MSASHRPTFFRPDQIVAMHAAYEKSCAAMGITTKADILSKHVAARIVDLAKAGELDPEKLAALALADFDGRSRTRPGA